MDLIANTNHLVFAEVRQAAHEPHEVESGNPLLRLDPGMVIWTWIIFFLLLAIIGKFGWKPILRSLEERENRIKKSLADAEKAQMELQIIAEEQKDMIAEAEHKAIQIVQQSREAAGRLAMEIENQARREAERMVEAAQNAIESQKKQAINQLRNEAATLAVKAATKLVKANLDSELNRRLVDGYIKEMCSKDD